MVEYLSHPASSPLTVKDLYAPSAGQGFKKDLKRGTLISRFRIGTDRDSSPMSALALGATRLARHSVPNTTESS